MRSGIKSPRWIIAVATLVGGSLAVSGARAGMVTDVRTITGPGLGAVSFSLSTSQVNDDDVVDPSPNIINLFKRYDRTDIIDVEFVVRNTGGTTEYFHPEIVLNNTRDFWHDYHFELGFGTGANFIPSTEFDFLDFDQPYPPRPVPTSSVFTVRSQPEAPDVIDWSGGVVPPGGIVAFTDSIDVPDANARIPRPFYIIENNRVVGYYFTLRQFPTGVPEPAALISLGIGLPIALFVGGRRRGRRPGTGGRGRRG
jgi:hypothetical protein